MSIPFDTLISHCGEHHIAGFDSGILLCGAVANRFRRIIASFRSLISGEPRSTFHAHYLQSYGIARLIYARNTPADQHDGVGVVAKSRGFESLKIISSSVWVGHAVQRRRDRCFERIRAIISRERDRLVAAHHHRHQYDGATAPLPFSHNCLCASYNSVKGISGLCDKLQSMFQLVLERHCVHHPYLGDSTIGDFKLRVHISTVPLEIG
ncbi:hypothetical protein EDB83DRAFT_1530267 [Lactarius deliciosus]|nr:hypothetical protein EDB83DRAFT_1530267 [Lactarius deliciosus]